MILALFGKYGGKWKKIALQMPSRHPDAIKNRYYSVIRRKVGRLLPPNANKREVIAELRQLVKKYETNI
jgi:hypothetical protein